MNKEEINQLLLTLNRKDDYRFEDINFSNFTIKIAAGLRAYSEPRRFMGKLFSYKSIQVQIFETVKDQDRIIKPLDDERFQKFGWAKHFSYEKNNSEYNSSIGYCVPIKDISGMIHEIYRVSKLKMFF